MRRPPGFSRDAWTDSLTILLREDVLFALLFVATAIWLVIRSRRDVWLRISTAGAPEEA